ncbi:MAG: tetratricopeptide repeat protein [Armatimonadota bacterium]
MRINLFDGLSIQNGEDTLRQFQTYKTGALLAYLAFYPQRQHSREQLVNLLWPDADPTSGRNRLTQALVWLRPRLEPDESKRGTILVSDRHTIGLESIDLQTDVAEFEEALQTAASRVEPTQQIEALRQAVDRYRGELLPGYYEDWVLTERQRLFDQFLLSLRRLAELYEQTQEYDRALDCARRALAADPVSEEVHLDLIRLLARTGQPAAGLRQFREMEQILLRELDEEPSGAALALVNQIRRSEPEIVRLQPSVWTAAQKLPAPLTRFFGRTDEIAQIRALISEGKDRLISLIGTGGCGKTRLAIEVGTQLTSTYNGAVWFIPLAEIHDGTLIPKTIADIVRIPGAESGAPLDLVCEWLSWRPALLILDNLEHLISEVAPIIQYMLARVPSLVILTTSRQRVGVSGEREVTVAPLPTPNLSPSESVDPEILLKSDSVQLFVDRARSVRPSFQVTQDNAEIVARLMVRLEGIPLAMELCAAWAQTLTPSQMLAQLSQPFDLLVSRHSEVTPRHRSLRAMLEYGWEQLPPTLQDFFRRLSVFRSGWTLEAAEVICLETVREESGSQPTAQALDPLTALRERSLVTVDEAGSEMRYRMLETVREFAAEKQTLTTDREEIRRHHAAYFLGIAEFAHPHMTGPDQADWLNRLEREHDNFRAALGWAVEAGEAHFGLRLAMALTSFWEGRGYLGEGQQWLARLLALENKRKDAEALELRANALNARGHLARNQGISPDIDLAMEEAVSLWRQIGDRRGLSASLQTLATITYSRDDTPTARKYLHEGLRLARALNDQSLMARALQNLGNISLARREWQRASVYYTESLSLYRVTGNRNRAAHVLNNLGLVARYQNDYQTALSAFHESRETSRELGDRSAMALTSLNLGTIHRLKGHYTSSRSFLNEAIRYGVEAGERRLFPWCIRELGHVACAQNEYALGVRLLAAAESQRLSMGISFKPADPEELDRTAAQARAAIGEIEFGAAWAVGSGLSRTRILEEILRVPAGERLDEFWEVNAGK